ncbi:MAG: ATP-binding cassette domain-containing protein, partial [Lachnospiraceae bacterium]|nr:ATP-binding cassette domain-containing protein [Lachnospiraceae bacterium]
DKDVLHDISLTIQPGEHLAIVGLNGAGKTTLVKLICGLNEPTEGSVSYNGTDIREYDRDAYYGTFGVVFQNYSIMPVTIAEIVGEDVGANVDEEKAERC